MTLEYKKKVDIWKNIDQINLQLIILMPPKKDAKKEAVAKPDNSGIPKQDVDFKFNLKVKTDAEELPYAVMIEWFGITSDKMERFDTPLIDSWQKGQQGQLTLQKVCDIIRVDDDFCKTLCNKRFYVYFVDGQSNKVEDTLLLDYSCLLMDKGQEIEPTFIFSSETIKVMGIDSFELKLSANKELLQEVYRSYLNPFQVEVIGAKNVPLDNSSKYQPAYIRYSFFDGTIAETQPVVGQGMLLWNQKHVFLAGFMDPAVLKEKLRHGFMKFELHDRDEIKNTKLKEDTPLFDLTRAIEIEEEKQKPVDDDPKKKGGKKQPEKKEVKKDVKKDTKKKDVKLGQPILPEKVETFQNNYGVSAFYLVDFLKPSMRTGKYKAPVVPKTTFEDFESKNIDLNTTARNEMQKIISSNNYFEQDTILVVGFTISTGIGTFVKPIPEQQPEEPVGKGKKQVKQAPPPPVEDKSKEQKAEPKDVFERVIYVMPYKSSDLVKKIDQTFYDINLKAFDLKNKRQISTFVLNEENKKSPTKDYITGIQLMDNQSRVYILQGLRNGSMKRFHQFMIKSAPNTKTFKILKNSNLTYLTRLYADFGIELKRMRFRPSLTQLLLSPSVYIKSKVAEEISVNLNKVNQIKKICDDLKTADSMNLWPQAGVIVQIQRKFSDSLSFEDIHGYEEPPKRKKDATMNETFKQQKTINFMVTQQLQHVTGQQFFLPKIAQSTQQQFAKSLPNINQHTKKHVYTKTFNRDDSKMKKTYNMQLKKADVDPNQQVYIYSGQKNNWYDKKMKQLREKIVNDKNHIYTYSKDYLGQSIDPHVIEEEMKKQMLMSQTRNIVEQKFNSLIIRTKEERMKLPKKPSDEDIEDLKNYPYHEQKAREKQMKKNTRDLPIHSDKQQFQKYLQKIDVFSSPEVMEGEKISPIQRFRQEQAEKKKLDEQNRKKMMGDPFIRIKKGYFSDKATGIDRFKDIREGSPVKKGIIDVHKKTKTKRPVEDYEVSFILKEDKIDPSFNPLIRRDSPNLNYGANQFNNYQTPQILTMTGLTKPLKKGDIL